MRKLCLCQKKKKKTKRNVTKKFASRKFIQMIYLKRIQFFIRKLKKILKFEKVNFKNVLLGIITLPKTHVGSQIKENKKSYSL